ncbi:hypothetical protein ZWY2020_000238, partial [Hordeum vulgare]
FSRIHTSLISVWRAISRAQVEVRPQWENGAPNNASSQTKNYVKGMREPPIENIEKEKYF